MKRGKKPEYIKGDGETFYLSGGRYYFRTKEAFLDARGGKFWPNCTCEYDDYAWSMDLKIDCPVHGTCKTPEPELDDPCKRHPGCKCLKCAPVYKVKPMPKLPDPFAPFRDDPVDHPAHYTSHPSGVEAITITEAFNFNIGNAIKYLWRAGLKGDALVDLRKAEWYVKREISRLEDKGGD